MFPFLHCEGPSLEGHCWNLHYERFWNVWMILLPLHYVGMLSRHRIGGHSACTFRRAVALDALGPQRGVSSTAPLRPEKGN
jgi:hypothetical protein